MEFVTFEIAKKLKEKGFNEKCLFAYNDEQVINPKVVKEYGNLSDDGYYELTEDGGGKLKWDNVYIYEQQIILRDKIIIKRNFIDAPTISQVLKWLREEKKIHIGFGYNPRKKWRYVVMYIDDRFYNKPTLAVDGFLKIEQAAIEGVEYVIDNLI